MPSSRPASGRTTYASVMQTSWRLPRPTGSIDSSAAPDGAPPGNPQTNRWPCSLRRSPGTSRRCWRGNGSHLRALRGTAASPLRGCPQAQRRIACAGHVSSGGVPASVSHPPKTSAAGPMNGYEKRPTPGGPAKRRPDASLRGAEPGVPSRDVTTARPGTSLQCSRGNGSHLRAWRGTAGGHVRIVNSPADVHDPRFMSVSPVVSEEEDVAAHLGEGRRVRGAGGSQVVQHRPRLSAGQCPQLTAVGSVIGGEGQCVVDAGQFARLRAGRTASQVRDTTHLSWVCGTGPQLCAPTVGAGEVHAAPARGQLSDRPVGEVGEPPGALSTAVGAPDLPPVASVLRYEDEPVPVRCQRPRPGGCAPGGHVFHQPSPLAGPVADPQLTAEPGGLVDPEEELWSRDGEVHQEGRAVGVCAPLVELASPRRSAVRAP